MFFHSCSFHLPVDNSGGLPDIVIHDRLYYRWFRDSTLNDFIRPALWGDPIPGEVVIYTHLDYTGTLFPARFWGVRNSTITGRDTLYCEKCDCEDIHTLAGIRMQWYFDSLEITFVARK